MAKGRAATVVRLGWEFNGTFRPWSAWNTQDWTSCYRHAALALRATATCCPGDDVVDIVGIDNYDQGHSAATQADFDRIAAALDGLTWPTTPRCATARRCRWASRGACETVHLSRELTAISQKSKLPFGP